MESEIHWKPMTGGRKIPSILPCITVEEREGLGGTWYKFKHLDKNGFVLKQWTTSYPPRCPEMTPLNGITKLPVLRVERADETGNPQARSTSGRRVLSGNATECTAFTYRGAA